MALLVVLLLISITLALSYAAVRTQHQEWCIQRNSARRISARAAAATGLTMAIKKMHVAGEWNGADSTLSGRLNDYETFSVTYSTGDPSLNSGDPDYDDLPYRVTLQSTGYAADPDQPTSIATYQIRAVMRLIPRTLAAEPADWAEMTSYTLFQWKEEAFEVNVPVRIEGPVRVQKKLTLSEGYAWHNDVRERFLSDLNLMRLSAYPDWRPFDGPIDLPYQHQTGQTIPLLNASMSIPTRDVAQANVTGWNHPGALSTYRIYPGGKTYNVQGIGAFPQNVTLEPDPQTNPLGIFHRVGTIRLQDNVTIRGTVVASGAASGSVHFEGQNIHLMPMDLPPLDGTSEPVQLPVLVLEKYFDFHAGAQGSLRGLLTMRDKFDIKRGTQYRINVPIQGRIVAKKILIRGRSDWDLWANDWQTIYDWFLFQESLEGGITQFPVFLALFGLDPQPRLTIKPDPAPARYHWHNTNNPIYVAHPDDDGLRWDLLEWTENP